MIMTIKKVSVWFLASLPALVVAAEPWFEVKVARYESGTEIVNGTIDEVDGGTWSLGEDAVATASATAIEFLAPNKPLAYHPSRPSIAKTNVTVATDILLTDTTSATLSIPASAQTAIKVATNGNTLGYQVWNGSEWVQLVNATPKDDIVKVKFEMRYEEGTTCAVRCSIDGTILATSQGETWLPIASNNHQLQGIGVVGLGELGNFSGKVGGEDEGEGEGGGDEPENPNPPTPTARTLYVDAASTNSLGTAEAPFATLSEAFAATLDHDTIAITGGEGRIYAISDNLVVSNALVTIRGIGPEMPTIHVNSGKKFGLLLGSNDGGATVSNLHFSIRAGCLPERFIRLIGPNAEIVNCEFAVAGEQMLGYISNTGYAIIDLTEAPGGTVKNCRFTNVRTGNDDYHYCTLVRVHDGATIVGNVARKCGRLLDAKNNNTAPINVISNVVVDCARSAGALFATGWNTLNSVGVIGNVVRSTAKTPTGTAIELAGNYTGGSGIGAYFANNTFINFATAIKIGLNGRIARNGIANNLFVGCGTNICDQTAGGSFSTSGMIRNNASVNALVPLAANRSTFVLDGAPLVKDNVDWRGLDLQFVNLSYSLSPNYGRPYCDSLTRFLKTGGWTNNGLLPAYVGAKMPIVGPGFVLTIDGYSSKPQPKDDDQQGEEDIPDQPEPEITPDPICEDPEAEIQEAVGELGIARQGSGAVWRIVALDPTTIILQADYRDAEHKLFYLSAEERKLSGWKYDNAFNAAASRTATHRPATEALIKAGPYTINGQPVANFGVWKYPMALVRYPAKNGAPKAANLAEIVHIVYLKLAKPLVPGNQTTWRTPTGAAFTWTYQPNDVPTPLIKVNQVGYAPEQGKKYAYLGAWLGPKLGAYQPAANLGFELVDATSGEVVKRGKLVKRVEDRQRDGGCFLGEETLEADFSDVTTPGQYFVRVDGIGRSETFPIKVDAIGAAFAVHMKGLFHQRCGCAKTKDLTHWTDKACHMEVMRGIQTPNLWEYDECFFDERGVPTKTTHFQVITANLRFLSERLSLPGGWHDAADYDRRPMHLGVVNSLISLYMLRTENFTDSQLAIPERGNSIPDILDEAEWGLKHLRAGQQADGGVGTWIETTEHPTPDNGVMPSADPHTYCIARATRESSLEYAGHAAYLARAFMKCGTTLALEKAADYQASAIAAWNFSRRACPGPVQMRSGWTPESEIVLYYQEPEALDVNETVKAAINLYALTGEEDYLKPLEGITQDFKSQTSKKGWSMSYDRHSEFVFTEINNENYREMRNYWHNDFVLRDADAMLLEEEGPSSYAYRVPWYSYDDWRAGNMSWGTCHPLRRAIALCIAHTLTGRKQYLDAAYIANDFHNGCNANGITWTAGLGKYYPVSYLSIASVNDGIAEYIEGITPFRNTYGMTNDAKNLGWNWDESAEGYGAWPFWRRYPNVEERSVGASEFTVTETIAPAVFTTGYLLDPSANVPFENRVPADDLHDLPGYWALP